MSGPKKLLDQEDNWVTSMGAWFGGDKVVFRGKNLFTELHDKSWMEIWLYAITGRDFDSRQIELWNRLWVLCSSFPEPRIWNNRVAALAGSAKATAAQAVAAATAVSEAKNYGRQADLAAFEFVTRVGQRVKSGIDVQSIFDSEFANDVVIPAGFGRPVIRVDERVPPVMRLAEELGFDAGPHYRMVIAFDALLAVSRRRVRLNIGGLAAAISADQGLDIREYYHFVLLTFTAGNIACYQDAVQKTEGTFFPLRCERIAYRGVGPRKWKN